MEFTVDILSLKGPGDNFFVDEIANNGNFTTVVRKVVIPEGEHGKIYSRALSFIPTYNTLRTRTGEEYKLSEEELEWLENVKKFMSKFQYIIEQDLSE
jgi:hypothetical protein